MKHDVFTHMNEQMTPDEQTLDALLKKIKCAKKRPAVKPVWIAVPAAAACAVIAVPVLLSLPDMTGTQQPVLKNPASSNVSTQEAEIRIDSSEQIIDELVRVPEWEERTIYEQYTNMTVNGASYFGINKTVDQEEIGEFLGETTAVGYDETDDMREYQTTVKVYTLKSISEQCLLAVQYPGHEGYYVFKTSYTPASFGQMIDDLNLKETLQIEGIFYDDAAYEMSKAFVWDFLQDIRAAEYADPYVTRVFSGEMGIKVSMPFLKAIDGATDIMGSNDLYIGVSKEGYIITNIYGSLQAFDIGKEKANAFMDNVINNGQKTAVEE